MLAFQQNIVVTVPATRGSIVLNRPGVTAPRARMLWPRWNCGSSEF